MAKQFSPLLEDLRAIAADPANRRFAIGGARAGDAASRVVVFDAKGKAQATLEAPTTVVSLSFASEGMLIGGMVDGRVAVWDASQDGKAVSELSLGDAAVNALAQNTTGTMIAAGTDDGTLLRLAIAGGKLKTEQSTRVSGRPLRAVAFDTAGRWLAAGGDDGVARATRIDAEHALREMPLGESSITALTFVDDGRLCAGSYDGSIRLCYLEGAVDAELRSGSHAHEGPVVGLFETARLYDENKRELPRRLISAGGGELKAWQLLTKRKPQAVETGAPRLRGMVWVPATARAKDDVRGGTAVSIDASRRINLVTVDREGAPAKEINRLRSELDRLADELRRGNTKVRTAAVSALASVPEDQARTALERALLEDKESSIRTACAKALAAGKRRRSRASLRHALADKDTKVRDAAFDALVALSDANSLSPYRAALAASSASVRIKAVNALPALRDASPLVPSLVAARLSDDNDKVRKAALDAVFSLESDPLAAARTSLARGPADVQIAALKRLGVQGVLDSARSLLQEAFDAADGGVRQTAFILAVGIRANLAAALASKDSSVSKVLAKLRKEQCLPAGADRTADPTPEDLQPLFAAMACRHADVALAGARGLAALRDPRAIGALLQLSREDDPRTRAAAVNALRDAALLSPEDPRTTQRLSWLLDDAEGMVRGSAFEALATVWAIEAQQGKLRLASLALDCAAADIRSRGVKLVVGLAKAPADVRDKANELLTAALDDEESSVRSDAFQTLWSWLGKTPQKALSRVVQSRHADLRLAVIKEAARNKADWAQQMLLDLVSDTVADVALAAYKALTDGPDKKRNESWRKNGELHLAALQSPRPEVRAEGCKGARKWAKATDVRDVLVPLVEDTDARVYIAAIEAVDRLVPSDQQAFAAAFNSDFYALRIRAGELCGKRRDNRAVGPMQRLLSIPEGYTHRPTDEQRHQAARAIADVGDPAAVSFYVTMLSDADGLVREMGARGLATGCKPTKEAPLVAALGHEDLAVRSWVAEGLARLGDARGLPVIFGTLRHEHTPIRLGALLSLAALGPDGARGLLLGLDDTSRDVQELTFAIVAARDVALAQAGQAPDLLVAALSSAHPEIRFVAARMLELRAAGEALAPFAQSIVGPRKPERASEMKEWPDEAAREQALAALVRALASDHPAQRYAAARVLSLRAQAKPFWREAQRFVKAGSDAWKPFTNWEDDAHVPRKRGWMRQLLGGAAKAVDSAPGTTRVLTVVRYLGDPKQRSLPADERALDKVGASQLVFGCYAGLVRQAPAAGESDETHRVRRDSLARITELAGIDGIGLEATLPIVRQALSDPNHLVRRSATEALGKLYPADSLDPLAFALASTAKDVGRGAVDGLLERAADSAAARELALTAIDAPNKEVRAYALSRLPTLFDEGSLEPWLLALAGKYADVRLAVVDRLLDNPDERVRQALVRAMESDDESLRLKASTALAGRGDVRTVDVLAAFLRHEEPRMVRRAQDALLALAGANQDEGAQRAAEAFAGRIEDDPDKTADRLQLVKRLGRVASPAGADVLLSLLADEDGGLRKAALDALLAIAKSKTEAPQRLADGRRRQRYDEARLLDYLDTAHKAEDATLRQQVAETMRDVDDNRAEAILAVLLDDREPAVRVAAAETLAFRAEVLPAATLDALAVTLRTGRRELVLPAAAGMATRRRPEAFQALLLVFKAGEPAERDRAAVSLGALGDARALEHLEPLIDPNAELTEAEEALRPAAAEALARILPLLEEADVATRVRGIVERILDEPGQMRSRACTGLRHAGDDYSRKQLERLAGDPLEDSRFRAAMIHHLGVLGNQSSEACLAELLQSEQHQVQTAAFDALNQLFPEDRTRVMLHAMESNNYDLMAPAASFLAEHGDATTLVGWLPKVDDASTRDRLRQGLMRRGACPRDAVEALLKGEHAASRADAAWLVGAAEHGDLAGTLLSAVSVAATNWRSLDAKGSLDDNETANRDHESDAWRGGLWALSRVSKDVEPHRDALTKDAPPAVRAAALHGLAQLNATGEAQLAHKLLLDRNADVRSAAAAAYVVLDQEAAIKAFAALDAAANASLMPIARAALDQLPDQALAASKMRVATLPVAIGEARTEALQNVLTSKDEKAQLAAVAALGRVGGETSISSLTELFKDESKPDELRKAAYRALRRAQRKQAKQATMEAGA